MESERKLKKTKSEKNMKKSIIVIAAVIILVTGAVAVFLKNRNTPPPVLTANFIDLDKVEKISKFRSCQGHTVVPQDESERARNMKHYVVLKPEYSGKGKVEIFSPLDGFIQGMRSNPKEGLEGEIWIGQEHTPWAVSFEHITLADGLQEKQKVKAGELIGFVPDKGVDVVYAIGGDGIKVTDGYSSPFGALDSVFSHMSAEIFGMYQAKGVGSADTLIYSREYRDQHPCRYLAGSQAKNGQLNDFDHPEDWIFLK